MCKRRIRGWCILVPAVLLSFACVSADLRERMRAQAKGSTALTAAQAAELTLTSSTVERRVVQVWVRGAGRVADGGLVVSSLTGRDSLLVAEGQRVRAFAVASRSLMTQGRVQRAARREDGMDIEIRLAGKALAPGSTCIVEIVADLGERLSVPNEALIEEGDRQVVYLEKPGGTYEPREVRAGVRGELFVEILEGLSEGDRVATTGSFFIDAEYKSKRAG